MVANAKNITSAAAPVFSNASAPVAPRESPTSAPLTGAVSHAAASTFSGAVKRDLGQLGGAARKELSFFPWPGKGSAGRPGWINRQDPTPTTDVTGQFQTLNAKASDGQKVLPSD